MPVALALILGIRATMRGTEPVRHRTTTASTPKLDPEPPPRALVARTVDGSYNDLAVAGDGHGRHPVRAQRAAAVHRARAGRAADDAQPAAGEHGAAGAGRGDDPGDDAQRHRRRVAAVPDPRLVQPRHGRRAPASRCRARRRPLARGPDPAAAHRARPARRPAIRRRTFVNTETHWWDASQVYGATPEFQRAIRRPELGPGKVAIGADGLIDVDPAAARQLRRPRRLVGRPRAAAHAVHARAQRRLRRAARGLPVVDRRPGVRQGPPGRRRADREDPHRRVDDRDPRPPRAADRHARQLVRPRRGAGAPPARPDQRQRDHQRHPRLRHGPPLRAVLDHRGVRRGLPDAPAHPGRPRRCGRSPTRTARAGRVPRHRPPRARARC